MRTLGIVTLLEHVRIWNERLNGGDKNLRSVLVMLIFDMTLSHQQLGKH